GPHDWRALAEFAERDPKQFLGSLAYLDKGLARDDLLAALDAATRNNKLPRVVTWSSIDGRRVALVPPDHWLLVREDAPVRATPRLCLGLGDVTSNYDRLLGANLSASGPVARHIFARRVRVWANADRFISALDGDNLVAFEPGAPGRWRFAASAGDGRTVEIE